MCLNPWDSVHTCVFKSKKTEIKVIYKDLPSTCSNFIHRNVLDFNIELQAFYTLCKVKPVDIHDGSHRESEDGPIYFRLEMSPEKKIQLWISESGFGLGGVSASIENPAMKTKRPAIMEPGSLCSSPR
jgi:hypothetical protein